MTLPLQHPFLISVLDVWRSGQISLQKVMRWSQYVEADPRSVRHQDSLQHSYALMLLGFIVCDRLSRYGPVLDGLLIQRALLIHDHGEGELGSDTLYIDKSEAGDLNEYLAFVERYSSLPPSDFREFHRAFLLQFALKCPASFPREAKEEMQRLVRRNRDDCLAFEAIERFDYVLYAWEQERHLDNARILVQVLRNQMPHLDRLAEELIGFGTEIWTPAIREYFREFLAQYEGRWVETK